MNTNKITIIKTEELPDDVLLVRATVSGVMTTTETIGNADREVMTEYEEKGKKIQRKVSVNVPVLIKKETPTIFEARGWVSAIENHFGKDAYQENGERKKDAKPRRMTDSEKDSYLSSLIREQNAFIIQGN